MSKTEELLLDNGYEGVTYLTDFDYEGALVGVTSDNRCCYDFNKMVEYLVETQRFSEADTTEWIEYNTIRALPYAGRDAPIIVFPLVDFSEEKGGNDLKIRYCNMCGKKFDEWDEQEDYSIYTHVGYGSKYDGDNLELDLCCDCMDKLIEQCKISPIIEK